MNRAYSSIPELPKINLPRFDSMQKMFKSQASIIDQLKNQQLYQKNSIRKYDKEEHPKQKQSQKFSSTKQMSNPQRSIFKLQYKSKYQIFHIDRSVNYFRSLLLQPKESQQHEIIQIKKNLRQIDKNSIISRNLKINPSNSEHKIKIIKNTKYDEWIPKKVQKRQLDKIRSNNLVKIKQLQNTFFMKCPLNRSILKLSKSQNIKN